MTNQINMMSSTPKVYHLLLLIIIILSAGVRLTGINRTIRWDESRTIRDYATNPPADFLFNFSDTNNHFFNTLLMHIQYRVLGIDQDWKTRLHVFVIGLLVTLATYYVGKELYAAEIGLVASALTTVLYLLVEFSINARGYIIITLIYLLIIYIFNRIKNQPSRKGWLSIGLLSALGFFVSPIFLYTMGTLGLWMLISIIVENGVEKRRQMLLYFMGAMAIGAILTGIFYAITISSTFNDIETLGDSQVLQYTQPDIRRSFWGATVPNFMRILFQETHYGMPDPLIGLFLIGAILGIVVHFKVAKHRVPIIIPSVIWIFIQISVQQTFILERTFVFLMPIYALLIASGWMYVLKFIVREKLPEIVLACGISVVLITPQIYAYFFEDTINQTWVTGAMPYGREVVSELINLEDSYDELYMISVDKNVLDYYIWRDNLDISLEVLEPSILKLTALLNSKEDIDVIAISDFSLRRLFRSGDQTPELDIQVSLTPIKKLTEIYNLFKMTNFPILQPTIADKDFIDLLWFYESPDITYTLSEDMIPHFLTGADNWSYLGYRNGQIWRDYQLKMRVKINQSTPDNEDLIIRFRERDNSSYGFSLGVNHDSTSDNIGFRMDNKGQFLGYTQTTYHPLEIGQWYDVMIDIKGNTFTAFIDDQEVLQWQSAAFIYGGVSFLTAPNTQIEITNIQVDS